MRGCRSLAYLLIRQSHGGQAMTSKRRGGRPTARQQRLANREANRALARASAPGRSGVSGSPLLLYTAIAVVVAAVVIGAALLLTSQNNKLPQPLGSPNPPVGSAVTPSSIRTNGLTLGNPDAKHTIDVYEDFQCPNCLILTLDIEPEVISNYVATGKAKLVYHDLLVIDALAGGHESLDAANAARCAADQGMFWPYHDWLFANQYSEASGAFTKDRLKTIGQRLGIKDLNKFNTCVDSGSHNSEIQTEQTQMPSGLNRTPSIVVDGGTPLVSYDYGTISSALDSALGISPSPSVPASGLTAASGSGTPTASPAASPS
jgi:protein-disulfide isomerase